MPPSKIPVATPFSSAVKRWLSGPCIVRIFSWPMANIWLSNLAAQSMLWTGFMPSDCSLFSTKYTCYYLVSHLSFPWSSRCTFSGSRPGSLPPQPLRNANHLPEAEAETLHFAKTPSAVGSFFCQTCFSPFPSLVRTRVKTKIICP